MWNRRILHFVNVLHFVNGPFTLRSLHRTYALILFLDFSGKPALSFSAENHMRQARPARPKGPNSNLQFPASRPATL